MELWKRASDKKTEHLDMFSRKSEGFIEELLL